MHGCFNEKSNPQTVISDKIPKKVSKFHELMKRFNTNNSNDEDGNELNNTLDDLIVSADEDNSFSEQIDQRPKKMYKSKKGFCEFCGKMTRKPTLIERVNYVINTIGDIGWTLINPDHLNFTDYLPTDKIKPIIEIVDFNSNAFCKKITYTRPPSIKSVINKFLARIFLFTVRMILKTIKFFVSLIVLTYFIFILVCNLPFATVKNFINLLKCFTGVDCLWLVPLKLPGSLWDFFLYILQTNFVCRKRVVVHNCSTKCFNLSNSTALAKMNCKASRNCNDQLCETIYCTNPKKCASITLVCLLTVLFFYCRHYPEANACKISLIYFTLKSKLMEQAHLLYMFPGEECMRAGRCCRGQFESFFRWGACMSTIPLRIMLAAWPKSSHEVDSVVDINVGIKMYIDKLMEELNQMKEDLAREEQILPALQTKFIVLEQKVTEKANTIDKIKPRLFKAAQNIDTLEQELEKNKPIIKEIITLRNDADKMVDNVRNDAKDNTELMKSTIQRLRSSIDAERQRIRTQIDNLEKLLKDEVTKTKEKNSRLTTRLQIEIDQVKKMQVDLKTRLQPLNDVTVRYKELEDSLIRDLRNKLSEEMAHHEQMSKRGVKFCTNNANKLNDDLRKVQDNLVCFINTTLNRDIAEMKKRLVKEIQNEMDERTRELARISIDQLLTKTNKPSNKIQKKQQKQKKCGLYPQILLRFPSINNASIVKPLCMDIINNTKMCPHKSPRNMTWALTQQSDDDIQDVVDEMLADSLRLMAADGIGRADFALQSAGASIILEKTSDSYNGRQTYLNVFGFTIGRVIKSVEKVLQPENMPGECWAFKGNKGFITIKLSYPIYIDAVSIDHVHRSLTPTGDILSAPKIFVVYGFSKFDDPEEKMFGKFEYNRTGDPVQTFEISAVFRNDLIQYVKFEFLSNQGNEEYTCIYRLRVHGNREYN